MQHLSPELLNRYRTGSMDGSELLNVDDHLARCEHCRAILSAQNARNLSWPAIAHRLSQTSSDEEHITYDQLKRYADGAMPPNELDEIESHISTCSNCRAEAADLKLWAAELKKRIPAKPPAKWLFVYGAVAATLLAASLFAWRQGQRSTNDQGTQSSAAALPAADRAILADVLRTGNLPFHKNPSLNTLSSTQLGDETKQNGFELISPVASAVLSLTPTLSWQSFPSAQSYQVQVFDLEYQPIQTSPVIHQTSWTVSTPLERGKLYTWQVKANLQTGTLVSPQAPAPEPRFQVLNAGDAAAIEQFRKTAPNNHLLLAAKYASLGLCQETLDEVRLLQASHADPALFQNLQRSTAANCSVLKN
jgi:hypothetical protein